MTLNEVISIVTPGAEVLNPTTGLLEAADTTETVFAHVRPLSGAERQHAAAASATAHYRFTIINQPVADDAVILWNGDKYNVRFVARASSREVYLRVDAERGVTQ